MWPASTSELMEAKLEETRLSSRGFGGRLLGGEPGGQVGGEAGGPARGAKEVGVGGEALAAHPEIADLPRRHQHHHRGLAGDREGEHRAEGLDAAREIRVLAREGPAGAGVGPRDREARALEVHGAEAGHVGDLLADLEEQRLRAVDAGALGHALDLVEEVGGGVADRRPEGQGPATRGLRGEGRELSALAVDQLEVRPAHGTQGLAVLATDLMVAAVQMMVGELRAHAAACGQTSGITWSSTDTMRSISGRVSTSGGASTRVLPRWRPPPDRPTITPSSWQRSVMRLIWAWGITPFEARSVTSATPAYRPL